MLLRRPLESSAWSAERGRNACQPWDPLRGAHLNEERPIRRLEIFLKGESIAAHMRMSGNHKHTTVAEHMPSSHRRYAGWTIESRSY
jgi:transposase